MQGQLIDSPFFIPSIAFLIISIPLVFGLIPRNRWYGIRTSRTLSDDDVWFAANRFGGLLFILSSLVYLCTAVFIPYIKSAPNNFSVWAVHLAAFVLPLALSIFLTLHRVRNL